MLRLCTKKKEMIHRICINSLHLDNTFMHAPTLNVLVSKKMTSKTIQQITNAGDFFITLCPLRKIGVLPKTTYESFFISLQPFLRIDPSFSCISWPRSVPVSHCDVSVLL